jgi:hypothetical protein
LVRKFFEKSGFAGSASTVETEDATILQIDQILLQCGLADGAAFDVFLLDIVWRACDRALQDKIMEGGEADFSWKWNRDESVNNQLDAGSAAAIGWALSVRSRLSNSASLLFCAAD